MKTHLHVDCLGFQLTGHKRVSVSDAKGDALGYRVTYFSETGWHLHQTGLKFGTAFRIYWEVEEERMLT